MIVLNVDSANHALKEGLRLIGDMGVKIPSRVGETIEVPMPVATVYKNPENRVLMSKVRDANPFFHLMESMWILAGRRDTKFLCEFNSNMINYSDDGITFNAPYGYRLRKGPDIQCAVDYPTDQIKSIIDILKNDPNSRQAIGQIWDVEDLNDFNTKDKACNMQVVFRVRQGKLCLTVYNRSNDIIWGAYGANVVQFSILLEYVAAKVGIPMGTYTQVSNSYHVYTEGQGGLLYNKLVAKYENKRDPYQFGFVEKRVIMRPSQMDGFEHDMFNFFRIYDILGLYELARARPFQSEYFSGLVFPMLKVFSKHKLHGPVEAMSISHEIKADDWRRAAQDWLEVRVANRLAK